MKLSDAFHEPQAELKETPTKDEQKTCYEKAIRKAYDKGAQQKAVEAAINLLKLNVLTPEQIAQAQRLPLEKVLELQKEITVQA